MWSISPPELSGTSFRHVEVFVLARQDLEEWDFHAFINRDTGEIRLAPLEFAGPPSHVFEVANFEAPSEVLKLFEDAWPACYALLQSQRQLPPGEALPVEDWEGDWSHTPTLPLHLSFINSTPHLSGVK